MINEIINCPFDAMHCVQVGWVLGTTQWEGCPMLYKNAFPKSHGSIGLNVSLPNCVTITMYFREPMGK